MNEERVAVLRMLSEGKITVEEAETLLDALGEGHREPFGQKKYAYRAWQSPRPPKPPRPPRPPRSTGNFVTGMEQFAYDFGDSIADTMEESFGAFAQGFDFFETEFDTTPEIIAAAPGTTLTIKGNSGSLALFGTDEPNLKISGTMRGHYRVRQNENKIDIKAKRFGATLTVHIPRTVERLIVKTHLGEIIARNFTGALQETEIQTHTGNIAFETKAISKGKIWLKSYTGMVKLVLPEQSACTIQAVARHMGEIDTDLPLENLEQDMGYIRGVLNGGGADIRVATHTGGVFIKSASPSETAEPPSETPPPGAVSPDDFSESDET